MNHAEGDAAARAQEQFKKKVQVMRAFLGGRAFHRALAAMELGLSWHTGTRRDRVTPEFSHQIEIAFYALTLEGSLIYPEATVSAIFLHDLVEDYPDYPVDALRRDFDPDIADPVLKLSKMRPAGGARYRVEDLAYYEEIALDPVASVGKGADRIHNLSTMVGVFGPAKQLAYVAETEEHVLPMLKAARRRFTRQAPVYENMKFVLTTQMRLIRAAHRDAA